VIYAAECPRDDEKINGTSIYAPSRCIGYLSESIREQCQGEETCQIDHSVDHRPQFLKNQSEKSNCDFKGESVNIEYSCIPDFHSSKLPRIDLCSLHRLDEISEGFIHSPFYPEPFVELRNCSKTIPTPEINHRLKIFAVDLDLKTSNWLEFNSNGNRLKTIRNPFTLIYDDIIEASIELKSSMKTKDSNPKKFLLYFIVTPIRRPRPAKTTMTTTSEEPSISLLGARVVETKSKNFVGLTFSIVLLSAILFVTLCGFLLYKRRNDRRVRYLVETFNAFFPSRSAKVEEKSIEMKLKSTSSDHIYSADPLEEIIYETISTDSPSLSHGYAHLHVVPKQ